MMQCGSSRRCITRSADTSGHSCSWHAGRARRAECVDVRSVSHSTMMPDKSALSRVNNLCSEAHTAGAAVFARYRPGRPDARLNEPSDTPGQQPHLHRQVHKSDYPDDGLVHILRQLCWRLSATEAALKVTPTAAPPQLVLKQLEPHRCTADTSVSGSQESDQPANA